MTQRLATGDWQGRRGSRQKINNSKTQSIKKAKGERRAHSRCPSLILRFLPRVQLVALSAPTARAIYVSTSASKEEEEEEEEKGGANVVSSRSLVATAYGAERCRHARPRHPTPAVVEIAQHFQGFRNVLLYLIHSAHPAACVDIHRQWQ